MKRCVFFDSGENHTIIQVAVDPFAAHVCRFCGEADVATERQTDEEEDVGHAKVFG